MTRPDLVPRTVRDAGRLLGTVLLALVLLSSVACSTRAPAPRPTATPTTDWNAVGTAIGQAVRSSPGGLDNLRAVQVSVDDQIRLEYYRRGFTRGDHEHAWSVTKSVVATLIGIAVRDHLIADLDQPLSALLPAHRKAMSVGVAATTLRQLMSMSGGFSGDQPSLSQYEQNATARGDFVDFLLQHSAVKPPGQTFVYSNVSADLAAAVLDAALQHADGSDPRSVLEYARNELFDPLGIISEPAFSKPIMADPFATEFTDAGFAWGTNPDGLELGGYGLRLTVGDLLRLGELYRHDGAWGSTRILPEGWVHEVSMPSQLNEEYGLFWWVLESDTVHGYGALGSYGQRILVLPEQRAVIAVLSTSAAGRPADDRALDDLLQAVVLPALR